jgi:hypothetical protein
MPRHILLCPVLNAMTLAFFLANFSAHIPCTTSSQTPRLLRVHLVPRLQPAPPLHRLKRRLPTVQLPAACFSNLLSLPRLATFELMAHTDGLVAAEALAHVDHAAFTLAKAALQLLALRGEGVEERWGEAFGRRVPRDEDAVTVLEALC